MSAPYPTGPEQSQFGQPYPPPPQYGHPQMQAQPQQVVMQHPRGNGGTTFVQQAHPQPQIIVVQQPNQPGIMSQQQQMGMAQGMPQVIQQQPQAMVRPQALGDCPPGLEYLQSLDQLLIKQKVEVLEMITGFETNNKYRVLNSMGQPVYFAQEDTDCLLRWCCGPSRPFDMRISDNYDKEIIHLNRGLRCDSCCCPCFLQKLEVTSPPGNVIGTVEQQWSIFCPKFVLKDAQGQKFLKIEGPFCTCSLCGDVDFELKDMNDQQIGKISKQWTGLGREAFTDADNFGVSFPLDLPVKQKAVLIGAVFLIDFMFFEQANGQNSNMPGMMD